MLESFFSAVLAMSLTGSALWLLLRLARPLTNRLCSARWEQRSRLPVLLAYLFPMGFLLRPLLHPAAVLTVPAALSPYGAPASLPPAWTMTAQGTKPDHQLLSAYVLLAVLRLMGVLAISVWLTFRQGQFSYHLHRTSLPVETPEIQELLSSLCQELQIERIPPLFSSHRIPTPLSAGLWNPAVYLPEVDISTQELAMILRHELIHLKRQDLLFKWIALAAFSLHWFNPAAWSFAKELGHLSETACDEAVTEKLNLEERRLYGSAILNVLYQASPPAQGVCSSLCSGSTGLEQRLRRILHPHQRRHGQFICTLFATVLVSALLPFSSAAQAWTEPKRSFEELGDYQVTMTRTALSYLPLGITYDAITDTIRCRGEALSIFMDTVPPTAEDLERFPNFTRIWKCNWYDLENPEGPALRAVRDEQQQLIGIAPLTEEEQRMFWDANENTVCYNSYYTSGDDELYASDPDWASLPDSVRRWALSLPDHATAVLETGNGGYLCYRTMHCPWLLKWENDSLKVFFYPRDGGDATRPCIIRYTAKSPPTAISFFVDDTTAGSEKESL